MSLRAILTAIFIAAATGGAAADPVFKFEGYVDGRLIVPSDEESWFDGGLGKLRWSEGDTVKLAEIVGAAHVLVTPEFSGSVTVRIEEYQKTFIDVLEGYVRYRPVSTSQWRWSIKAGAFFPPISLENNEIGWTSEWSLTPSAINSWVGDELRTIGAEAEIEWRSEPRTLSVVASAYGYNDPAGVLMAFHGWTLEDRPSGLIDHERRPNAHAILVGQTPPTWSQEIMETDGRVGWYAGLNWDETGFGTASILYYDNRADPTSYRAPDFGWRTKFWSVGAQSGYGDVVVIAQALWGDTEFKPSPFFDSITDFESAFVLVGWYVADEWRLAARADWFSNRDNFGLFDEDGHAFTLATSWLPKDWLRLSAELINAVSDRPMRAIEGDDPRADETQFQFSARVYF